MLKRRESTLFTIILCISLIIAPFMSVSVFAAGMYESYSCVTGQKENYSTINWENVEETPSYPGNGYPEYDIVTNQVLGECNLIKIENTTATRQSRATAQICSLFPNEKLTYGTAIMIGPSTALTAAHCVYNSDWGGYAKGVSVAPARNLNSRPYGYTHSSKISIPTAFKSKPVAGNDIAVLNLREAIGKKSGYMGCKSFSTSILTNSYNCSLEINGYPGSGNYADLSEQYTKLGEMWGMGGDCIYANGKLMRHNIDTFSGMSGAGIVAAIYNQSSLYVVGTHDGYPTNNKTYNHGTRIDSEYLTWINGLLK